MNNVTTLTSDWEFNSNLIICDVQPSVLDFSFSHSFHTCNVHSLVSHDRKEMFPRLLYSSEKRFVLLMP